jgi:predicted enzyme related to lactoylglutathione lyase
MSEPNQAACPTGGPKTGQFSWNELVTGDASAAAAFYGQLFGWATSPFKAPGMPEDAPPYAVFNTGAGMAGGLMQNPQPGAPTQWVAYVVVDNADVTMAKAIELGAKVLCPVMAVPTVGRVAVLQDPQGATIGLHELPK